ncbi:MAG: type II toxin-antitoxin system Phd/YefM family antitoxin [Thiohalocapsa sp.]
MRPTEQVKSVSYLKAHAAEVIRHVQEVREPVIVTQNGEAKAVLQDIASYEDDRETLALLKILALGNDQIARGETRPAKAVFADLRARLSERNKEG